MTTIAYKDGILAADTQLTIEATRFKCTKINRITSQLVIACAGDTDDENKAIHFFSAHDWRLQTPPKTKKEFACIVIHNTIPYFCSGSLYAVPIETPCLAIGSGWNYAMAGMEMGFTAEQAVQYASKFDIYTNSITETFNVSEQKEVKGKKQKAT